MIRWVLAAGLLIVLACGFGAGEVSGVPVFSETSARVVGSEVRFVANVDSETEPLQITVDWGDATTDVLSDVATGAISARHVYDSPGAYTIIVEAVTPEGGSQVAVVEITIEESAVAGPATTFSPTTTLTTTTTQASTTTTATSTTGVATTSTTATVIGGDLLYHSHEFDPTGVGQFQIAGLKLGARWAGFRTISASSTEPIEGKAKAVIYAVTEEGDLLYYRHGFAPTGEPQFEVVGLKIGAGWDKFNTVIAGFGGRTLYAVTEDGDLLYYRHQSDPTGEGQFEVAGVKIGAGWAKFKTVTAGRPGVLYAITEDGDLLYYSHQSDPTGEGQFEVAGVKIGAGWAKFKTVTAGGFGILYAITEDGDLLYYRHQDGPTGEGQFEVAGVKIGADWAKFKTVTAATLAHNLQGALYAITEP